MFYKRLTVLAHQAAQVSRIVCLIETMLCAYTCMYMSISMLLCHLIYWTEAQLSCSVTRTTPLTVRQ